MPSLPSTADPFRDLSLSPPQGSLELPASPAPLDLALPDSALPGSPELDLPGSLEPQAAQASPLDPEVPVLPCRQSPPLWSPNFSLPLLLLWLRPWLVPGGAPVFPWEVPTRSKSTPTAQLSTTLSTRSLMTSNRTTLPVRSPGMVIL